MQDETAADIQILDHVCAWIQIPVQTAVAVAVEVEVE